VRTRIADISPGGRIDALTSLVVRVEVENDGAAPVTVDHGATRVFLELSPLGAGGPVLSLDDERRQRVLLGPGGSASAPYTLAPGERRTVSFDLAQHHAPFRAGAHLLTPCFASPSVTRRPGPGAPLVVEPAALRRVESWYENPVFGARNLLLQGATGEARLRWIGLATPLASFFDLALAGAVPGARPVPVVAAFHQLDDFVPGFERILAWETPGAPLTITRHVSGRLQGVPLRTSVVLPGPLLASPFRTEGGDLFAFALDEGAGRRRVVGVRVAPDGTGTRCLEHDLASPAGPVAVGGGPDVIHLVEAGPPLVHVLFDHRGRQVQAAEIALPAGERLAGTALSLSADVVLDAVRAVYAAPGDARAFTFVEAGFPSVREPSVVASARGARLATGGAAVREVDFLVDGLDRLNVLYSTSAGRLLFFNSALGFSRLARGAPSFFPRLLPGANPGQRGSTLPFVGFFTAERGYRFYEGEQRPWPRLRNAWP
jgi:hypothetical protein